MGTADAEPPAPIAASPPLRSWPWGIAPHYIGLFLWIAFLDALAVRTLPVGGLGPAAIGAAVAGVLCFGLLYYAPAMWGLRARESLPVVATSTFGVTGARWVPGLVLAAAQVVWFAVATHYALDFTMRGLVCLGLLDPRHLQPWLVGGLVLRSPVFLAAALVWTVATAVIGVWAVRLIAALMQVYPLFPALALAGAMLWAIVGLPEFRPLGLDPITTRPVANGEAMAVATMVQLIFGFFATAGLVAADWGAASRDARDVRLGGLVGVAFAIFILATLSLITVAGTVGRRPPGLANDLDVQARLLQAQAMRPGGGPVVEQARRDVVALGGASYTLGAVFQRGIGGWAGGTILLVFGLGSMAPAVYAGFLLGHRLVEAFPFLSRRAWNVLGSLAGFPLVALGLAGRTAMLFGVVGGAIAPLAGALAADYVRQRGAWPGPRRGVNWPGMLAWLLGTAVGLTPAVGREAGWGGWSQFQPAAVAAFGVGFAVYLALAGLGLESRQQRGNPAPGPEAP